MTRNGMKRQKKTTDERPGIIDAILRLDVDFGLVQKLVVYARSCCKNPPLSSRCVSRLRVGIFGFFRFIAPKEGQEASRL